MIDNIMDELRELCNIVDAFSVPFYLNVEIGYTNLLVQISLEFKKKSDLFDFSELRQLENKLITKGLQFGNVDMPAGTITIVKLEEETKKILELEKEVKENVES